MRVTGIAIRSRDITICTTKDPSISFSDCVIISFYNLELWTFKVVLNLLGKEAEQLKFWSTKTVTFDKFLKESGIQYKIKTNCNIQNWSVG